MQQIIDITPVSSETDTAHQQPLTEPPRPFANAGQLLRARLIALVVVVALAGIVFVTVAIGAVIFLGLLGLAAAGAVVLAVRRLLGKPTESLPARRRSAP